MPSKTLTAPVIAGRMEPGSYTDRDGLTLRVHKSGSKNWVQRITVQGKQVSIGLGGYPGLGLADARAMALNNRTLAQQGKQPKGQRQRKSQKTQPDLPTIPTIPTFSDVAQTVIDLRKPTWSSDRHAKQWTESLTNHAYPALGNKPIDVITSADVLAVLTPIWTAKAETATRVKQRIEAILDYAIIAGYRIDNPASAITKALPRRPRLKEHHAALPYADVPATLTAVRESTADPSTKLAFEFLILNASRTGEVRGATWDEIDLDSRTWTIPASRMKARREHRIPLTDAAIAVLDTARPYSRDGLIFPAKRKGGQLSNMVFEMLLRRLDVPAVPHGFRSSFKDWSIETGKDWAVSETALAHNLGNSMQVAYARTDLFCRRRELMDAWAEFLG